MNEIIEIFLERGHISKEAAERLEECEDMTKEAFGAKELSDKALEMVGGVGAAGRIRRRRSGGKRLRKLRLEHAAACLERRRVHVCDVVADRVNAELVRVQSRQTCVHCGGQTH